MSCVQFELVAPRPDLRKRLRPAFVTELSRLRADDLPHDLPGNAEVSAYRLDRLTVDEVGATDLRNRLHDQHSNLGSHENGSQCGPSVPGSRLDADHPENGVLIPCRNTRASHQTCLHVRQLSARLLSAIGWSSRARRSITSRSSTVSSRPVVLR